MYNSTKSKSLHIKRLQKRLAVARGEQVADILLTNCKIVNVFNHKIEESSIAIFDEIVIGIGDYKAEHVIDLQGRFVLPGFIESHIHIESSKLIPKRFAEVVVKCGTTTVVADPHEIANVWGLEGIIFMIENASDLPVDIYYMLPSCVPATDMETAGANLSADDLESLVGNERVIGIGELMNFPGAFMGFEDVLSKTLIGNGKYPIDGHSPRLSGNLLDAYLIAGPHTDHECTSQAEVLEKLSKGMRILVREGSTARNLETIAPLIDIQNERRFTLATDDRSSTDLLEKGHLNYSLKYAVSLGLDPITAVRMITLNPAETHRLYDRGGIKAGWLADLVVVDDLNDFNIQSVYKSGRMVFENGKSNQEFSFKSDTLPKSKLNVRNFSAVDFDLKLKSDLVNVIGIIPEQIVTNHLRLKVILEDGAFVTDTELDLLKIAVIERHSGKSGYCVGVVQGIGLKKGALASTVAHDSHNIIVVGVDDESMARAVNHLTEMGGGQVAVDKNRIIAELPLEVGGLMSQQSVEVVAELEEKLLVGAKELGTKLKEPFMALSFLALPVIPSLKISDKGIVNVDKFQIINIEE